MRALVALLLLCASVADADELRPPVAAPNASPMFVDELAAFDAAHARTNRLKLRTMDVLLAGGILSTLAGVGLMVPDSYDQGLRISGALTASFGAINVILGGLSIPNLVKKQRAFEASRAARSSPAGLFEAKRQELREQHADVLLFGINLGLDGGYILAGLAAIVASQLGADHPDRWLAGGVATLIQGVFLAGVDTTAMLVANRRHAAVLESIVPLLGFTNTAKGLEGSVGVAGRF